MALDAFSVGQDKTEVASGASPRPVVAPLTPVALAVMAGITADRYGALLATYAWAALSLVAVITAMGRLRSARVALPALLIAFVSLGGAWHHFHWSDLDANDLARVVGQAPQPVWVRGVVEDVLGYRRAPGSDGEGITRAVLRLSAVCDGATWRAGTGNVQLVITGDRSDLVGGEAVEAAGSLAIIPGPLNPGEFDYRAYLQAHGIRLRLAVDDNRGVWHDSQGAGSTYYRLLGRLRHWSRSRLALGLDPKVVPLAEALLLGRREAVDPDVNDAFARTGTTHLLAISGLHMQVLSVALLFAFRAIGLGRRNAFLAVGLATIVYTLLVGLMPSVVRSAAMTITMCAAGSRDRQLRPANVLSLAALVTLALNPADLFDVGCQLSFIAIAAILWGVDPASRLVRFVYYALTFRHQGPGSALDALERRLEPWWLARMRKWPPLVWSGVMVSTVVWLVALPLVALRFHIISPVGVLLNVPLVPLTSLALMAAGLSLGLSAIWMPLGAPAAWVASWCLAGTEFCVRLGASWSWGHWFVPGPAWWWVVGAYFSLGLATAAALGQWPVRRLTFGLLAGWLLLGGVRAGIPQNRGALEAEILAVGHGLATVIQAEDGRTFVYDCGRMRDPSVGRRIVAPALWGRGVSRLDAVILSHADSDHYNGLPDLLDRFSIAEVRIAPGFAGTANPEAVRLLETVRARGIPIRKIVDGDSWNLSGAHFSVWHPTADASRFPSDNAQSIVLDVESRNRHFLLTGDLEKEGLTRLKQHPKPAIDAMLSPHHGGRTANPAWLYDWAQPGLVVVSQRVPSAGAFDALGEVETRGIPLLRTWQRGAVRLRWERDRLSARGFLDGDSDESHRSLTRGSSPPVMLAGLGPQSWPGFLVALGLVAGFCGCFLMAVAEWGAWALVLPGRRMSASAVDLGPGEAIEARASDGTLLAGVWHSADSPSARTILMIHGFADYAAPPLSRIEALNSRGWNVARLDMRGYGRSSGNRATFGGREAEDIRAWIETLVGCSPATSVVAVWGRSMGAAIAVRAAAIEPRIRALVLDSPMVDLNASVVVWLQKLRLPWPGLLAHLIAGRAAQLAGVSLTMPRPLDAASSVPIPALIAHGSQDTLVSMAEARKLALAFAQPAVLLEIAGAGHGKVFDVGGPKLFEQVAGFLDTSAG